MIIYFSGTQGAGKSTLIEEICKADPEQHIAYPDRLKFVKVLTPVERQVAKMVKFYQEKCKELETRTKTIYSSFRDFLCKAQNMLYDDAIKKMEEPTNKNGIEGVVELKKQKEEDKEEKIYYARCNLKVIKGNYVSWVNWQSTPTFIPVDTKLKVTRSGSTASIVNIETGSGYTLDIGADGDVFLEKFVTKKPLNINQFSADVQSNIKNTVARIGMTKQEVYIAMGPPTNVVNVRSNTKTYEDIMGADLWVYARKRFGKNIGVAFDPATGRVNRTEGIWK